MGLDITVVAADWEHLARIPAGERLDALTDAVHPYFCCASCEEADRAVRSGWASPLGVPWCAEYRFAGTTGTYVWHFWLAELWQVARGSAEPGLRDGLDAFLGGLVWDGPHYDEDAEDPAAEDPPALRGFPDDPEPWRPRLLLGRTPDEVPALARAWQEVAPRLAELRGPVAAARFDVRVWPDTFDGATALMREWGEVVTGAAARGWGLVGLPY
ncbi:hypothetical protein [Streptomyces sp. C]|uniref:hypothetical protein n=1 Tax=Streptomyces sp. C TaxID=253839 RepID=UPI0001B55CF0|nr:hypothetical protein [Streptomyces sp. C]EFL16160.1 predicted protein [Streptomyces sp. C]